MREKIINKLLKIFQSNKRFFEMEGMKLSNTYRVNRIDFEEFGYHIGFPARVIKRGLDVFAKENLMVKVLFENSFLSNALKRQYWLFMDYRQKMLAWRLGKICKFCFVFPYCSSYK